MDSAPIMLSDADVAELLDLDAAIAAQRKAFEALGNGTAHLAEKVALPNPGDGSVTLCYLSRLSPAHGSVCKLVDVHPGNAELGLPTVTATVLVLDARTGQLAAMLPAGELTVLRTAAASAVAADALAGPDADGLAVLGSGRQAMAHVRALHRVRPLREVRIWSPDAGRRAAAASALAEELGIGVAAAPTAAAAVAGAPLVATCTLSEAPVLAASQLAPGATVLSVGSFEPHRCEVGADVVRAARVVVDDVATALRHAGPVMRGVADGTLDPAELVSLGDVLVGRAAGRSDPEQLVFYNSVGLGVQDAAAALQVLAARAASLGAGRETEGAQ
ncbi:MAG TPA: ornithine cyclodeaminase family protein [Pseudonocardia sp.]|nr:ornithine cyclodeaminase family protein [Pseudonocardia sp.]